MRAVFADAAYWIGLFNPKDSLHEAVTAASRGLHKTRLVTSEMVLTEVLNGLAKYPALRGKVVAAIDAITAKDLLKKGPRSARLMR